MKDQFALSEVCVALKRAVGLVAGIGCLLGLGGLLGLLGQAPRRCGQPAADGGG